MPNKKHLFKLTQAEFLQVCKIALGSFFAIMIAEFLNLQYATSAGIITLLTIQTTKKETFLLSAKRVLSFFITISLAYLIYNFIGTHAASFGVFMFFLVAISYCFKWHGAISVNAVFGTHILMQGTVSAGFVANEAALLLVGTVIAIFLNLFMLDSVKVIEKDVAYIEDQLKQLLLQIAYYLDGKPVHEIEYCSIPALEEYFDSAVNRAIENSSNTLYEHSQYYIAYMEMRKNQCGILQQIHSSIFSMTTLPTQAKVISDFIEHMAFSLHERTNVTELIIQLQDIFSHMKEQPLPSSREEFENRALLYHVLIELEAFLNTKNEFISSLTNEQITLYWEANHIQAD